jgi:hypothetical protein
MYFDRFDILSAYYLFGSDYHGGQFTKEYAYIGRALNAGFSPGPLFSYRSLSDNGKAIYNALCQIHKYGRLRTGYIRRKSIVVHSRFPAVSGRFIGE